jgi:hypothetical protein
MRISSSDYIQNQGSHPAFGPPGSQLANNPFVPPQGGRPVTFLYVPTNFTRGLIEVKYFAQAA